MVDLRRWNLRSYEMHDDEGGDPAVIRYRPVTQAWRLRLLEHDLDGAVDPVEQPKVADLAAVVAGANARVGGLPGLWRDLLLDLVDSVTGLTMGGEPLDRESAIDAMVELSAPAEALIRHMLSEAEVTAEQEKR